MYDHVDLFSGLGCWALAARVNGLRTIAFCEREEWLAYGLERTWGVPCHRDIKTFPAKDYAGRVWLLTGSPPCQPASFAGKRRGKADDRWLWPQTISVCEVIKPSWFCFENPPGLDGVGLDGIISDLEGIGYEVATLRIPACAVNSPQLRDRFWIVGNRQGERLQGIGSSGKQEPRTHAGTGIPVRPTQSGVVANAKRDGHNFAKSGSDKNKSKGTLGKWDEHREVQRTTQSGAVADSDDEQAGRSEPSRQEDRTWAGTSGLAMWSLWQDFNWLPFNDAVYRAPVGLYSLADGVVAGIPKRFRAKLISALGNCIVPQVATKIIAAIVTAERNHGGAHNDTICIAERKNGIHPELPL